MAAIMMSPPYFSIEQSYFNVHLLAVVALMVNVYQHLYRVQNIHVLYYTYEYLSVVLSVNFVV